MMSKRLFPGRDRVRQWSVRRLVGKILLAGEESQKRPALLRNVIADRTAQHGIPGLKSIEHRPLRNRTLDLECRLAAGLGQDSQMLREYYTDHGSVCTSTESTAGRSRTIGAQLSPASAEA